MEENFRNIAPTELHVYRRHLKLSIADTAKHIAKCSNLQWSAYEYGDEPVPQEILARFSKAADEYRRMVDLMRNHPKHLLPQIFHFADFRKIFPGGSYMSWRVYFAIISELCVAYRWKLVIDDLHIPADSPLWQLDLTL